MKQMRRTRVSQNLIRMTRHGLFLYACTVLIGCVSVRVEPLTHDSYTLALLMIR